MTGVRTRETMLMSIVKTTMIVLIDRNTINDNNDDKDCVSKQKYY